MGVANSSAHLSSSISQIPKKYNVPTKITLENQNTIFGITNNNGDIIIDKQGIYLIIVSAQVAQIMERINIAKTCKCFNFDKCHQISTKEPVYIDIWLTINDIVVPNSGARVSVSGKKDVDIIMFQRIVSLESNDRLNIYMNVVSNSKCKCEIYYKNNDMGLIAFVPNNTKESIIPSITVSINKFSEI